MQREDWRAYFAVMVRMGREQAEKWVRGPVEKLWRTHVMGWNEAGQRLGRELAGRLKGTWQVAAARLSEAWVGLNRAQRSATLAGTTAVAFFLLLALTGGSGSPAAKPLGKTGGPRFIAYFENSGDAQAPGSFPGLQEHHALIDTIMPLWFNVDAAGTVVNSQVDQTVDAYASSHGINVEPMFINLGYYMLTDPVTRENAATNISGMVVKLGFAGADVDFELLPPSVRADFSVFIQLLAAKMHKAGKVLSVTVFPKPGVSYSVTGSEDYPALAKAADYLVLMAYDNHSNSSGPGPVAPLPWVRAGIRYALREIPPAKLVLAVGQYGYDWDTSTGITNYVSTVGADQLAQAQGVPIQWDAGQGESHFQYGSHTVWFQNPRSLALDLRLVQEYHLRGYALWRLGFETPGFWTQVAKVK